MRPGVEATVTARALSYQHVCASWTRTWSHAEGIRRFVSELERTNRVLRKLGFNRNRVSNTNSEIEVCAKVTPFSSNSSCILCNNLHFLENFFFVEAEVRRAFFYLLNYKK